ncbi:hypothetical protein APA_3455 [Pseudanabaena sp. lw0831]|nr:hypothetical protein APA_3455 [Pseudanabaena sp. lw0831]
MTFAAIEPLKLNCILTIAVAAQNPKDECNSHCETEYRNPNRLKDECCALHSIHL